jgi:hypothetical protein
VTTARRGGTASLMVRPRTMRFGNAMNTTLLFIMGSFSHRRPLDNNVHSGSEPGPFQVNEAFLGVQAAAETD